MNHRPHIDRDRHSIARQNDESEAKFFTFFQVTFIRKLAIVSDWNLL